MTYQFRFKSVNGKLNYIYATTLEELREQEKKVQKDLLDGINYCEGNINVITLAIVDAIK